MPTSEDLAWHYTSAASLVSILEHGRLWAGSAALMNDSAEIQAGREALRRAIQARALEPWQRKQLERSGAMKDGVPDEVFLLSASKDADSLTLWRSYGTGTEAEYAIALDTNVPLMPVMQSELGAHPHPPRTWYSDAEDVTDEGVPFPIYDPDAPVIYDEAWTDVEYLRDDAAPAEAVLDDLLLHMTKPPENEGGRRIIFSTYTSSMPNRTMFFKHAGFEDEDEVRAVWTVSPWWRFVLYRGARFGVTPYIEVGARKPGLERDEDFEGYGDFVLPSQLDRLPIRAVRIGPTRRPQAFRRGLRELLNRYGYEDVDIHESETPYR